MPIMEPLLCETAPQWIEVALANLDEVLCDHAHCEKKAAATAMSLVNSYPELDVLVKRMVKLAGEELRHFRQVHEIILGRGHSLAADKGDPYAKQLLKIMRHGRVERRTDRLLVAALIEARSCERLELLSQHLPSPGLRHFYAALATAEAGHHRLFVDLAKRYDDAEAVHNRLQVLAKAEANLLQTLPLEPRIH